MINLYACEDGTECSETSAYKIQTPGNCPDENIQHTEHGESLKSRSRKRSSSAGSEKMEGVGDRQGKMERFCSTGQSPQWAVVPIEEEVRSRDVD